MCFIIHLDMEGKGREGKERRGKEGKGSSAQVDQILLIVFVLISSFYTYMGAYSIPEKVRLEGEKNKTTDCLGSILWLIIRLFLRLGIVQRIAKENNMIGQVQVLLGKTKEPN